MTRKLSLDVLYLGHAHDPWGNDRVGFEAHGHIDREDWGLTWNLARESGGIMISKEIQLELHVELILTSRSCGCATMAYGYPAWR